MLIGGVDLSRQNFKYFPVKFGIVKGNFNCEYCLNLKTLEGVAKEYEKFDCSLCKNLKSLKGSP